jgi:hypothetical protein
MRTLFAALAAAAVLLPAAVLADTVSLKVTDPKDGYQASYDASWQRTPTAAERYWLCDRPLWVPSGVGSKISRLYQHGYQVELVAGGGDAGGGGKRVICTLTDPSAASKQKQPAGEAGDAPAK